MGTAKLDGLTQNNIYIYKTRILKGMEREGERERDVSFCVFSGSIATTHFFGRTHFSNDFWDGRYGIPLGLRVLV